MITITIAGPQDARRIALARVIVNALGNQRDVAMFLPDAGPVDLGNWFDHPVRLEIQTEGDPHEV